MFCEKKNIFLITNGKHEYSSWSIWTSTVTEDKKVQLNVYFICSLLVPKSDLMESRMLWAANAQEHQSHWTAARQEQWWITSSLSGQEEPVLPVTQEILRGMETESRSHRTIDILMPHTRVSILTAQLCGSFKEAASVASRRKTDLQSAELAPQ